MENLSTLLKKYENLDSDFYNINNYDNLIYTFLCISIQKNLNTYDEKIDSEKFSKELKKYICNNGGITMTPSKDEFPSLYSTAVGIMLEELILKNKEVPAIL
ncbi:hypothetical protein FDA52_04825 [Clostridium botulinum]|nr:hypothetical protein [Clostridium botulinum]NFI52294.1 hypothetical protein [Clostridium botulinum]